MELKPTILIANVMHKRLKPKINHFTYGTYYMVSPLSTVHKLDDGFRFGVNRAAILSFYNKDHGDRQGNDLEAWIRDILAQNDVKQADGEIVLAAMPRVFGYVFNPISLWFCLDQNQQLRAVLCEVNNTFGESHSYLCVKSEHGIITADDWLEAKKLFHVSPFFKCEGSYRFRFILSEHKIGVWIDYYDEQQNKQLLTSLVGTRIEYNRHNRRRTFWQHPLVTLKTISLIHWQALKLISKGIKYVSRPKQGETRLSVTKK